MTFSSSRWTQRKCRWSFPLCPPQPGQHPSKSRDSPGPRETNPPRDRQQQRTPAHAKHQRRLPVPKNTAAPHGRRETQQGAKTLKRLRCRRRHMWQLSYRVVEGAAIGLDVFLYLHLSFVSVSSHAILTFACFGPAGGHPTADSRVHLHLGAGEDAAPGTEQPAQTLHPGLRHILHHNCVRPIFYSSTSISSIVYFP